MSPQRRPARTVFVTGASGGIGQACCRALVRSGHEVFAGVRRRADGARLKAQLGAEVIPVLLDVTRAASVASAARAVGNRCKSRGLDGLVNNAGIAWTAPLECVPIAAFRELLEVNVTGALAVTQAFLPLLRLARGRIINVSSLSGLVSSPFIGAYAASKFALEALSDALRMELAPWGIEVVLIEPGPIATSIHDKSARWSARQRKRVPRPALAHYGSSWERFDAFVSQSARRAPPASTVADGVLQALSAPRPETRYPSGGAEELARLLRMPDRARDELLLRSYGLMENK